MYWSNLIADKCNDIISNILINKNPHTYSFMAEKLNDLNNNIIKNITFLDLFIIKANIIPY